MRRRLAALSIFLTFVAACSEGRDKWIADLQSFRPEERALAVKKLADRFERDDLGLFTQAARDPSPIVRAEAMTALGRSEEILVLDLLGEGLGDSDERVQQAAAGALSTNKSEKARAYLIVQFGRRSRATREAIVQALKVSNVPGAMANVVAAEARTIWDRNLKALQDGALPERVGAAEELGRSGRPEAVNRLVPMLKDNQVMLAAAAARGLGYAQDARAVPGLVSLLDENFPELREAACEALARLRSPEALPKLKLVALERSPTSGLATAAILAMPRTPETTSALCELLLAGDPTLSSAVGRELKARGGCPAEPILEKLRSASTASAALGAVIALGPTLKDVSQKVVPLLASPDPLTRQLAVEALAELEDPGAAQALLKAWDTEVKVIEPLRMDWIPADLPAAYTPGYDPDAEPIANDPAAQVKFRKLDLLRKVQALDDERVKALGRVMLTARVPREIVSDADEDQVRVLASLLVALGRLKVDGARERALVYATEQSPSLRTSAFAALAALGPDSLDVVKEGLTDSDRAVQAAAAQALASAGEPGLLRILEVLPKLSGDRTRLLDSLRGRSLPQAAAPVLIQVLSEGGLEAGIAAQVLADSGLTAAVAPLVKQLDDPTMVARGELLAALGALGDAASADRIGRELYSERPDLRAAAATALGRLGPGASTEALDALKGDYYLTVRTAAGNALSKGQGRGATP